MNLPFLVFIPSLIPHLKRKRHENEKQQKIGAQLGINENKKLILPECNGVGAEEKYNIYIAARWRYRYV